MRYVYVYVYVYVYISAAQNDYTRMLMACGEV